MFELIAGEGVAGKGSPDVPPPLPVEPPPIIDESALAELPPQKDKKEIAAEFHELLAEKGVRPFPHCFGSSRWHLFVISATSGCMTPFAGVK